MSEQTRQAVTGRGMNEYAIWPVAAMLSVAFDAYIWRLPICLAIFGLPARYLHNVRVYVCQRSIWRFSNSMFVGSQFCVDPFSDHVCGNCGNITNIKDQKECSSQYWLQQRVVGIVSVFSIVVYRYVLPLWYGRESKSCKMYIRTIAPSMACCSA